MSIGVGTSGGAGPPPPPPIFYPLDVIHTCSADCHNRSVYYVRPPQNGIASYAYDELYSLY